MLKGSQEVTITILSTRFITKISANLGEENSDLISVTTSKDLNSPSGTFQIVLVPKKGDGGDSWFDRVEVFDFVEIKFKGIKDKEQKVVMRGLVDNVQQSENYEAGPPNRFITISGRDLGCLLTDFQIYLVPIIKEHQVAQFTGYGLLYTEAVERGLENAYVKDVLDFLMDMLKKQINIYISGRDKRILDYLKTDAQSLFPSHKTSFAFLKGYDGPWINTFTRFQDKPFHELFIWDDNDYSWLILRPSRLKDARGKFPETVDEFLSKKNMYPDNFSISNEEKISMSISKDSREVHSYYITYPSAGVFGGKMDFWSVAISPNIEDVTKSENPYLASNEVLPSASQKFGIRPLEIETVYSDLFVGEIDEKDKDKSEKEQFDPFIAKGEAMNKTLVAWFLHNPLLLSGTIEIPGTNRAIIGTYMKDEDEKKEYYVEGVTHSFTLFQSFRTSLQLSRGLPTDGLEQANRFFFPI